MRGTCSWERAWTVGWCRRPASATETASLVLGSNLPNLTIQRTGGDKICNGTVAVDVPAPSHLTVAHNGTDLMTYVPSATNNQAVNIDCKTLTMNVGSTT